MKKQIMLLPAVLIIISLLIMSIPCSKAQIINRTESFLKVSGIWEGNFSNFVNKGDGIIQKGKMRIENSIDRKGLIHQSTKFFTIKGKQSDYTGYSTMRIKGNRLIYVGKMVEDKNT
ncbi:hypothetical protein DRQ09_10360, partial [candidate division KSB1 bacterium]